MLLEFLASQFLTRRLEGVVDNPLPVGLADMGKSDSHLPVVCSPVDAKDATCALDVGSRRARKKELKLQQ